MRVGLRFLACGMMVPVLALAAPAAAQQQPPPGEPPPAEPTPEQREAAEREIVQSFEGQDNFTLEGTAAMVDPQQGVIILSREGVPPAVFFVPGPATIEVGGESAGLGDIEEGSQVRATFNLAQQYPVALKLEVTPSPAEPSPPARPEGQEGAEPLAD